MLTEGHRLKSHSENSTKKLLRPVSSKLFFLIEKMGCPALGVWVAFLKQPALPGEAPQTKNNSKQILKNKNH
jgi:hypothetical protein